MKKPLLFLAGLMALVLLAPTSVAGKKAAHQHVDGEILLPQGTQGAQEGCVYRTQRALYTYLGAAVNGVFGYTFEVDPKTANKKFIIEPGSAGEGIDISFYADLGDPSDPTTAPAATDFQTPGPGGERGTVPKGFPYAFVCLSDGAGGSFSYMAGAGVK